MRCVVLGAAGQLGRDLCPLLPGTVIPLTRAEVDLTQPASVRDQLAAAQAEVVINCAAYNFVDKAEAEAQTAFAVNTHAVHHLAQVCAERDALLVQFSTDYVFGLDPSRTTPWYEDDSPGPVSVYGLSKLAGEFAVRMACPRHLIIRTCGLYGVWGSGGKGGNFVETMLRIAGQGKPLRVVADQLCTPSYTRDIAETTVALINQSVTGLVHVTNTGQCTWHDLAAEIFRQTDIDADLTPITSAEFAAPARRPAYSVLAPGKLNKVGLPSLRPWPEALAAYLQERTLRSPKS